MAIRQHASVKDIRLVLDKFTGAPRGFAFVHFHTVDEASCVCELACLVCLHNVLSTSQCMIYRPTMKNNKARATSGFLLSLALVFNNKTYIWQALHERQGRSNSALVSQWQGAP